MAFLAASLVAEVAGTLILLIACSPAVCAVLTSASLVAPSIAALALLTSPATVCFKVSFSSAVKFEASIASFLDLAAWSMAFLASDLTSSRLGTLTLLILETPASWAFLIASAVVAWPIAFFAAPAASVASLIKLSLAAWSMFVALLISPFLLTRAVSMAWLAALASSQLGIIFLASTGLPSAFSALCSPYKLEYMFQ